MGHMRPELVSNIDTVLGLGRGGCESYNVLQRIVPLPRADLALPHQGWEVEVGGEVGDALVAVPHARLAEVEMGDKGGHAEAAVDVGVDAIWGTGEEEVGEVGEIREVRGVRKAEGVTWGSETKGVRWGRPAKGRGWHGPVKAEKDREGCLVPTPSFAPFSFSFPPNPLYKTKRPPPRPRRP